MDWKESRCLAVTALGNVAVGQAHDSAWQQQQLQPRVDGGGGRKNEWCPNAQLLQRAFGVGANAYAYY